MFADGFDAGRAIAAVADERLTGRTVFECLINLARRSLIVAEMKDDKISYRLLGLSRAYAREKRLEAKELLPLHKRHSKIRCRGGVARLPMHERLSQVAARWSTA